MDARELWAKSDPYHQLWRHLLDVAAVSGALLRRFGTVETLDSRWMMYLAAMHDLGKADPQFQNKDPEQADRLRELGLELPTEKTGFRHEARSAVWIEKRLLQWGWRKYACRVVSQAIRAHHGDFLSGTRGDGDCYDEDESFLQKRTAVWNELRDQLDAMVRAALELPEFAAPEFADASAAGVRLVGLIVLADWIASNENLFGYEALNASLPKDVSPREYFAASRQRAEQVIRALEFDRIGPSPDDYEVPAFSEIWQGEEFKCPRPFQTALENACRKGLPPGLAILEAPMGEGKTESAIYLALHWNRLLGREGLYIALPTMATSNQMHSRYEKFLKRRNAAHPRLIHGMSWLQDEGQPEAEFAIPGDAEEARRAKAWFGSAKRAILAPEGVGTVDQVLMAALNVKHGFLRFLGLSARALIIDEVHAYDVYMTRLMRCLLGWCRALRIPVILLSATLSRAQKQCLMEAYGSQLPQEGADPAKDPYPLLTFAPWDADAFQEKAAATSARAVQIVRHYGMLPGRDRQEQEAAYRRTAELALRLVERGGCLCVLMNAIAAAQGVYRALGDFPDKLLFHARFPARRRNEIEKRVLSLFGKGPEGKPENPERPERFILVCTQVVEQSLDVDFDAMITQLAPMDLLLQRSGRIWRHERERPPLFEHPTLHVLLPAQNAFAAEGANAAPFGATGIVYDHHAVLLHTLAELEERDRFDLPCDFRPLIEACYGNAACPEAVSETFYRQAVETSRKQDAGDENIAGTHLIPVPNPRVFSLASMPQHGIEEREEGEAPGYFRASTRLGDETRNALFVGDAGLEQAIRRGIAAKEKGDRRQAFPGIPLLKKLFLQKAAIPAWWLKDLEPAEGYAWLRPGEGPDWTRRHAVFFLQNDAWRGRKGDTEVMLRNDNELGLLLETPSTGPTAAPLQKEEEQDADVGSAS